jgi:hypothetical protein
MKTARDTKWGLNEIVPAGTDVRIVTESQLDGIAGSGEGRALRECAGRMRTVGAKVIFGVIGNVRCFTQADFDGQASGGKL